MKKIVMLAVAALVLSPGLKAQTLLPKVNSTVIEKSIAKSDADLQNPKRTDKAYFWFDRGALMFESSTLPIKGLFDKMTEADVVLKYGKGTVGEKAELGGYKDLKVVEYPNFKVYYYSHNNIFRLLCWDQTLFINGASLEKASQAFVKSAELDNKKENVDKVKDELLKIANQYKINANNLQDKNELSKAADACLASYEISVLPIINKADTMSIYYAGYLYAMAEDFEKGAKYLTVAANYGKSFNGDIYYYIAYSYNSLHQYEKATKSLEDGVSKYPNNTKIVEMLATTYANEEDASENLEFVEKAAEKFSKPELWNAVGRIYDKAGNLDRAKESFNKALALNPDDFSSNFNIALMYAKQAQKMVAEADKKIFSNNVEYNHAMEDVKAVYLEALIPLEKAIGLNETEKAPVKLARDITHVIRESSPEMMAKYTKYKAMAEGLGIE